MRERIFGPVRRAAIRVLSDDVKRLMRHGATTLVDEEQIVTYRELSRNSSVRTWRFDRRREVRFDEPVCYNVLPDQIRRLLGIHTTHQPFVIEVPDVELIGQQVSREPQRVATSYLILTAVEPEERSEITRRTSSKP